MDYLPLPQFDPPAIVVKADPALLKAFDAPPVRVVKVAAPGWHTHRCSAGHEWSHSDASRGDVAAHTCPQCGRQDWTPNEVGVRLTNYPEFPDSSFRFALPASPSNCPGGVCPTPARRGLFR